MILVHVIEQLGVTSQPPFCDLILAVTRTGRVVPWHALPSHAHPMPNDTIPDQEWENADENQDSTGRFDVADFQRRHRLRRDNGTRCPRLCFVASMSLSAPTTRHFGIIVTCLPTQFAHPKQEFSKSTTVMRPIDCAKLASVTVSKS